MDKFDIYRMIRLNVHSKSFHFRIFLINVPSFTKHGRDGLFTAHILTEDLIVY